MDEILSNLGNSSWWFTGIFFIVVFKLLPFITKYLKSRVKVFFKGRRLKRALFIKSNRHNLAAVNFQSVKSQAFFVIFMIVCSLYLLWFTAGQLFQIQQKSYVLFLVCLIPMLIPQFFWMYQEDKAKTLVSEYNKVRATRR